MTQDSRLSLQGQQDRSKKICTKAEASQRRSLKVTTYPSPQRSKWESSSGLRESPFDKCLRESLSGKEPGGLWETPNQTTDWISRQGQDSTKSGLRPNC